MKDLIFAIEDMIRSYIKKFGVNKQAKAARIALASFKEMEKYDRS